MKIKNPSKCGTLESNDIFIILTPIESGIEIELDSIVEKQFGDRIKEVILEKLKEMNLDGIKVIATDKGALDYTIAARVETAAIRGGIYA